MAYQKELLAAFSEPTCQVVILERPGRRSRTVGELARELPISRPAVPQYLKVLKSAGLVEERRRGGRHYFHLNPATLGELRAHPPSEVTFSWHPARDTDTGERVTVEFVPSGVGTRVILTHIGWETALMCAARMAA